MSDEDQFLDLLDEYHATACDADRRPVERKILVLVDRNLRDSLLRLMVHWFGPGVVNPRRDDDARLTTALNEFFVKVLERRPDEFWRAKSLPDLQRWAATVVRHQMLDYVNREQRGRALVKEHAAEIQEFLAPLFERRRVDFEAEFPGVDWRRALAQIGAWEASADPVERQMATALQLRYVIGRKCELIAKELGLPDRKAVYRLLERAFDRLREHAARETNSGTAQAVR